MPDSCPALSTNNHSLKLSEIGIVLSLVRVREIKIIKSLTVTFSTCTDGRADAYNKKITLIPMPITIPISSRRKRHERKVAQAGIRSVSTKQVFNKK